ncbi:hypothetical protein CFC21_100521 [Triticum aestivum]|uniref:R13L1/DRL21-like LRR repeat region domain-containing protein n=2 Tax=Triticum aestivum TaxID=4565 RepID=A0A3B6RNQ0_WHEAT|nr:hypothetical protein CFC21_100521 [Triticum aestivum]
MENSALQHLSKYNSLQALQLCLHRISFPLKPKHLHHLRYLDLSRSCIKALPDDISIMYNLQTLNLSGCIYLGGLPRQLKYMTTLRHLYTHGCSQLKSMPRELGKLTCLQTLTCFVAGSEPDCSNVGELGKLNLGGQLELQNLENVTAKDAAVANLVNKELRDLTLRWSAGETEDDSRVLENLKPHDGLHAIRIHFYGSTTFPTWVAMLQNIVEIHLFDCRKLQWLFSHDCDTTFAFPKLKHLTLEGLVCLERWWEIGNGGMQEEIMFPLLEKLLIEDCKKLTALPGQPTFPNLQEAIILDCPRLTTVAKSPKLSLLLIAGREDQLLLWVARHMTSLAELTLFCRKDNTETTLAAAEDGFKEVVDGKEEWNGHDLPLAVLKLCHFKSVLPGMFACFVHLQDLSIMSCDALVHWPEREFQALVSLKRLEIKYCSNLTGYAPAEPSTSAETSQLLPCLEYMYISDCNSLVEVFNISASLRYIEICCCSKLESPFGRRLQQGQLAPWIHQGSSSVLEVSSSSSPRAGPKHLQVNLHRCAGLTGLLHLPPSLKRIAISYCDGLTSLEAPSGVLSWLESLQLYECNTLSSLPDAQAYSSLRCLDIDDCPGLKTLPASLQQRLGSLEWERIDAHHYGNKPVLLKPKTWKYAIRKD